MLEIARHHHLHLVAVERDQLAQEGDRQQRVAGLGLLLEDDLRQHGMGDVLSGLCVLDDEIVALLHHDSQVVERDIGAGPGVVEPPVRIFFYNDLAFVLRHQGLLSPIIPSLLRFSEYPQKSAADNVFVRCGDASAKSCGCVLGDGFVAPHQGV
ncbi:hypothetical protein D9M72_439220 [compost metagenome]